MKNINSTRAIAEALVSVQPMPSDTFDQLENVSKSKTELEKSGYSPISNIGLLWAKSKN